jgi:hypothetical protein
MYDSQYNRRIADEVDRINKTFIAHEKRLHAAGLSGGFLGPLGSILGILAPPIVKTVLDKITGSGLDIDSAPVEDLTAAVGSGLDLAGMKAYRKKRRDSKAKGRGMSAGGLSAGAMYSGEGLSAGAKPKKRHASGKVSKRAEIVKRVMKERGLSMIEASKYVKAHNLY